MKPYFLLFLIFLLSIACANSQVVPEKISVGEKVILKSEMYNEDFTLLVSLPENYDGESKEYPVVYRFDGEWTFLPTAADASMAANTDKENSEMIVVCIQNNNRGRDMLPPISEYAPEGASVDKFLLFLKNEVIPFVDDLYRTNDFRILCGQSTSGFFTLFAFIKEPALFNAYISISPSSAHCKPFIQDLAQQTEMTEDRKKAMVHVSYGGDDREKAIGLSSAHLLDILMEKGKDRDDHFKWKLKVYENEGHVPRSAFYDGLKWVIENM